MSGEISSSEENATGAVQLAMPLMLLEAACTGTDGSDLIRIFELEEQEDTDDLSEVTVVPSDPAPNPMEAAEAEEIAFSYQHLQSVTHSGDNILHILITRGRHDLAYMVFKKDRSLLAAPNKMGETPLHCAAKVGNNVVMARLINQAPDEVKAAIRKKNCHGETALHVAARIGDEGVVGELMQFDRQLAHQVDNKGLSPLYTAAVGGCTRAVQIMLENYSRLVGIPNPDGLFLIHVAAATGNTELIKHIMQKFPDSAAFTDPCRRNLLHIAADEGKEEVLREVFALIKTDEHVSEMVAGMIDAKDNEGNTPLHLAAIKGHRVVMAIILDFIGWEEAVGGCQLTRNNKGLTPFDLSFIQVEHNNKNRHEEITDYVRHNGRCFTPEWTQTIMNPSSFQNTFERSQNISEISQNTFERSQLIGLGAVLITTVAFAVAFTLPGGLNQNDGTPVLGRRYYFKAFIVANTLAFIQAFLSLVTIVMGALRTPDLIQLKFAANTFMSAAYCMVVAFGLGSYVMLVPISKFIAQFVLVMALLVGSPSMLFFILGERQTFSRVLARLQVTRPTDKRRLATGLLYYTVCFLFIFFLPYPWNKASCSNPRDISTC